jgi:hypothetical protein
MKSANHHLRSYVHDVAEPLQIDGSARKNMEVVMVWFARWTKETTLSLVRLGSAAHGALLVWVTS